MEKRFNVKIVGFRPGEIKGQRIAEGEYPGGRLVFDVIQDLVTLSEGDEVEIAIFDSEPGSMDEYSFCGRGYVVPSSGDKTIFSIWGILFRFEPGIGLERDKEYILCIKK